MEARQPSRREPRADEDIAEGRKAAEALLHDLDPTTRELFGPIMLAPLTHAEPATLGKPGVDPRTLPPGQAPPRGRIPPRTNVFSP